MPVFEVVRVIHEIKLLEAEDEASAVEAMSDFDSDHVDDVICRSITAELVAE